MSQPKSNEGTPAQELRAHAGYPTKFHPEYDLVIRLETAQQVMKEALAQKDAEVAGKKVKGWAAMNKDEYDLDNISFYNTKEEMMKCWDKGEQTFVPVSVIFTTPKE